MGCPALELAGRWVELGLNIEMQISGRVLTDWYYVGPGGLWYTNVLNSALPPQRLRPDTQPEYQNPVSHVALWLYQCSFCFDNSYPHGKWVMSKRIPLEVPLAQVTGLKWCTLAGISCKWCCVLPTASYQGCTISMCCIPCDVNFVYLIHLMKWSLPDILALRI